MVGVADYAFQPGIRWVVLNLPIVDDIAAKKGRQCPVTFVRLGDPQLYLVGSHLGGIVEDKESRFAEVG